MHIYPAIDIRNGECVRLTQGDFEKVTVYEKDPVKIAMKWKESGAKHLHLIDLDGARTGKSKNLDVIKEIIGIFGLPVQTGGGIRTISDIDNKLKLGASRVILGTAAVKNPDMIKEAVLRFGERIAVGVDAKDGMVAISGWEEVSGLKAVDFCLDIKKMGVKTVIYTDISKDGMLLGPNIKETANIIKATSMNVIASGGISNIEDIKNAEEIGAGGVIIGKALYNGELNLSEVIKRFER